MSSVMVAVAVLLTMVAASLVAVVFDRWLATRRPTAPPIVVTSDAPAMPVVAPPTISPEPMPDLSQPRNPRETVTIHLISAKGRSLGTCKVERKMRRPTLQYRPKTAKTAYTFVAERQHGADFIYRQVGQERE